MNLGLRTMAVTAGAFLSVALNPTAALGAGRIRPDSKIDTTIDSFPQTWVVDDADHLWRVNDGFGSPWIAYPEVAGTLVGPQGVATADWADSMQHEWVYFTNAAGTFLHEFRVDGSKRKLYSYAPPAGHLFTGHVEARSAILGTRQVLVAATTTTSGGVVHFLTCTKPPTSTSCSSWVEHLPPTGAAFSATSDIASGVWPGFQSVYFFIQSAASGLLVRPYYGGGWQPWINLGTPTGSICASIAATSLQLTATPTYELRAFCTHTTISTFIRTRATSDGTSWGTWSYYSTGVSLRTGPYALASARESTGPSTDRFAVFAIESGGTNRLIRVTHAPPSAPTVTPHVRPPEADAIRGGMAAASKDSFTVARASLSADLGGATYLFEHHDRTGTAVADDWFNVGGSTNKYLVGSSYPLVEGVLAEDSGWSVTAMMRTLEASEVPSPSPPNFRINVLMNESTDDGLTWTGEWVVPEPVTSPPSTGWNMFWDASLDLYGGNAYACLATARTPDQCDYRNADRAIAFLVSKSPGAAPAALVNIADVVPITPGTAPGLDHPWMEIDASGQAHVVWSDVGNPTGAVRYRKVDLTVSPSCPSPPCPGPSCVVDLPAPIPDSTANLTIDALGTVYYYNAIGNDVGGVCRLNPGLCTAADVNVCVSAFDADAAAGKLALRCDASAFDCPGVSSETLRVGWLSLRASTLDPGVSTWPTQRRRGRGRPVPPTRTSGSRASQTPGAFGRRPRRQPSPAPPASRISSRRSS